MNNLAKCSCCGQETIPTDEYVTICPLCGWEDDYECEANPDESNLPNPCSLNDARSLFKQYGDNIHNHFPKPKMPKFTEAEKKANWERFMNLK